MSEQGFALALMAPAMLFLGFFVAWPLVRLVIDSLYAIEPLTRQRSFLGFGNYREALTDDGFRGAVGRTVTYTVVVVALEFVIGLGVALLFNTLGQRARWLRTVFLYPLMIAPIVAGLLWRFLLIDNFGIVNELLARAGLTDRANPIGWLSDPNLVLLSVGLPDIWLTTSFMALVLFAGLQNLPADVLEAARLDGVGPWRMLLQIILPLMRPVIAVALIIRAVDATRAFDIILIQTNGGPQSASTTLSLLIYRTSVRFGDPGMASAMSTLYVAAMLVLAVVTVATIWRPGVSA
jgi:multiple sugar transport system permease protein